MKKLFIIPLLFCSVFALAQGAFTIQNNTTCDFIVNLKASASICGTGVFSKLVCVSPGTAVIPDPNIAGAVWDIASVIDGGTGCTNPCHEQVVVGAPMSTCFNQIANNATTCNCNFTCNFSTSNSLDIN